MSNLVIGDDGWPEIVGEQMRGGVPQYDSLAPILGANPQFAYELLGEMLEKSPAFRNYANQRAAASRPMIHKIPLQKARDWNIDFGPAYGTAGSTTTLVNNPQCLFRGEKVMATDTGSTAGYGTTISQVLIGQKLQKPAGTGSTLTFFFANNALGNGIKWDTCKEALTISVTVNFLQSCTFYMTVWGKAVT